MDYPIEEDIFYIFTDGASRSVFNPKIKRKSWRHGLKGVRFIYYNKKYKLIKEDKSDYISYTKATNQDMELRACIDGLKLVYEEDLSDFRKVMIVTDAMYVYSNRKNAFYWNRVRKSWKTIYGDPVVHKKERKELNKYMKRLPIHVDFDKVKAHEDNEHNNKADKSAVKWAQSNTKVLWNDSGARSRFFKEKTKVKWFLSVGGQEILIHIYLYRYLWKKQFRYNYEIVSRDHELFTKTGWIYYDKATLRAEFIYLVKIKDDWSHQIEEILDKYTKDEIREKMINDGIEKDIFFWKEEKNINPSIQKTCKTKWRR